MSLSPPHVRIAALALALAAAPAVEAHVAWIAVDGALVSVDTSDPVASAPLPVTGLAASQVLAGIDFRPQNGQLYGLGYDAAAGTVQLYAISQRTGVATALGGALAFADAAGLPRRVGVDANTRFGIDFNPTVDRLRVVNDAGQNFRLNPNNGVAVDGNGTLPGVQMDGDVSGTAGVDGTAYTSNAPNVSVTTQYTLDAATDRLFIQNPPNNGTQTMPLALTLAGAALDVDAAGGFDIPPGVAAASANAPVTAGSAFAVLRVGGVAGLYAIDLPTAAATRVAPLPGLAGPLQGFAVHGEVVAGERPAIALSPDRTSLLRFNTGTPGTTTSAAITGSTAGEAIAGIDFRPATGQLFALGVNAAADTATLYVLDPQTGAATAVGASGGIAFVDGGGFPVDLPAVDAGWGFDFNPTVDRVRVVTGNGRNFRLNPATGAPVDGDAMAAGVNPDGNLNVAPGNVLVGATAYTNSFAGTTVTTQYTLDHSAGRLYIQNPPNAGTQVSPRDVRVAAAPLAFGGVGGFDIPPATRAVASGTGVDAGLGYAVLGPDAGPGALYRIELGSGSAVALGAVGAGGLATGLALGDAPNPDRVFGDGVEPAAN